MASRLPHSRFVGLLATLAGCHPARRGRRLAICILPLAIAGCGDLPTGAQTVDLGDNFEAPDRTLDEDFFHCVIQPEVLTRSGCATGGPMDGGGCHLERSALRLVEVREMPRCDGETLLGSAPIGSQTNLARIRASVGVDAEASPFYRRPIGLDSHPREIFPEGGERAELIREWIDSGSSQ